MCVILYVFAYTFTSLDSKSSEGQGTYVCLIQFIKFGSRSNAVIYIKFSVNKFVELMNGNPSTKRTVSGRRHSVLKVVISLVLFWPCCRACRILVPPTRELNPHPPAVESGVLITRPSRNSLSLLILKLRKWGLEHLKLLIRRGQTLKSHLCGSCWGC